MQEQEQFVVRLRLQRLPAQERLRAAGRDFSRRAVAVAEPVIGSEVIGGKVIARKHGLRPIARRDRRPATIAAGRHFDPVFCVSHIAEGKHIADLG